MTRDDVKRKIMFVKYQLRYALRSQCPEAFLMLAVVLRAIDDVTLKGEPRRRRKAWSYLQQEEMGAPELVGIDSAYVRRLLDEQGLNCEEVEKLFPPEERISVYCSR